MKDFAVQIIRTLSPLAAGAIITLLVNIGIQLPPEYEGYLSAGILTISTSLWYIAIAWLEKKVPAFGWLLGVAKKPVYSVEEAAERLGYSEGDLSSIVGLPENNKGAK